MKFFRLFVAFILICIGLSPKAEALLPAPPPDGGYPNLNTAEGQGALYSLTTGTLNTAIGAYALYSNAVGSGNTAVGAAAFLLNTGGTQNVALGTAALAYNDTGDGNTASGYSALYSNTTGSNNTANGYSALYHNTTGGLNTANGYQALYSKTEGTANAALGAAAGFAVTTGDFNTCLGYGACGHITSANNVVCVGYSADGENFSDRAYIPNIGQFAQAPAGSIEFVTVRLSDGKLGHDVSARRYKEDIKPMGNASELIYKLKPVTYRFKKTDVDPKKGPPSQNLDYGLIAEEVAEIDPQLAIRDGKGQIESLRYKAIYNMLLNEFLKEHRKNEEQGATITALRANDAKQETTIAQQQKQIDALSAGLQKVSAQLEVSRPAPQVTQNNE